MRRLHHLVAPFLTALVVWILLQRCSEPAAEDARRSAPAVSGTPEPNPAEAPERQRVHFDDETPPRGAEEGARDATPETRDDALEVLVLDPDGRPIAGATVAVADEIRVGETSTTAEGTGVARARWTEAESGLDTRVGVHADGFAPWISEPLPSARRDVRITARLAFGGTISGVVVAHDEMPVVDADVRAWPRSDDPVGDALLHVLHERRVRTDASGAFRLTGLPPGAASIEARIDWDAPRRGRALGSAPTGTTALRLVLWRTVTVRFVPYDAVTGGGLRTLRQRIVELTDDGQREICGSSAVQLPDQPPLPPPVPERGIDVWGHAPRRFQVFALGYAASDPAEVDPDDGPLEQVLRLGLRPDGSSTARVRLRVSGRSGAAPDEVWVFEISPGGTGWSGSRLRLVSGCVAMDVMPGHVTLAVGNAPDGSAHDAPWLATTVELDLDPGELAERAVALDAAGFVRIRAPDDDLRAPERVLRDGAPVSARFGFTSDEGGPFYESPALPPGQYVFEFARSRGESVAVPCAVNAFGTTELTAPPR